MGTRLRIVKLQGDSPNKTVQFSGFVLYSRRRRVPCAPELRGRYLPRRSFSEGGPVRFCHVLASEVVLSPILVRPVREQLEHDRVIRLLQAKYKRKFEVAINPGNEQSAPVGGSGASAWYPDLVLQTADKNRKLAGVVEVESAESVNHLEAMSQWKAFAALRVPFHLYLPTASIDTARRFCTDMEIPVAEMWAYQTVGDQIRFTLVQRSAQADDLKEVRPSTPVAEPRPRAAKSAAARTPAAPARPAATSRTRTNGSAAARRPAARRAPAAAPSRAAAKPKAAAARRPAAKVAATRKSKSASSSRAQKRR